MSQTRQRPAALHRSHGPSADREIQIVVVEDHPPLRQGLELRLAAQGFRMIGSAGCAEHGARMIRARRPDVAIVDIGLGDASGTDLATGKQRGLPRSRDLVDHVAPPMPYGMTNLSRPRTIARRTRTRADRDRPRTSTT